ncbi:lipid A deacylase LpxR family protein [Microbulbifer salipaludis]|uniref:Lipid A deacylase LpxR family protein n=1 Tax=Microbulbifer salipaludis TaxID=187980 RepID=A0ABS3E1Y1_9GAMM|nr:lipid A deacylase LpxR family protein [Microbulbifer salipaludis]MBN8429301.1 lipid A deacylase LpxR family protein [Microbulbifer salipaludis]
MGAIFLAIGSATASAGGISLQLENDSFGRTSDADYTQGLRLSYTTDGPAGWVQSLLPERYQNRELATQVFLGQAIFTPFEVFETDLLEYDRPYAGWLYLGGALQSVDLNPGSSLRVAERFEVSVGIVGPSSGAEQAQRATHALLRTYDVNGWENQLRDEPTLQLSYARKWAHIQSVGERGLQLEWSATLGGHLGNVNRSLVSGVGVRFGRDLFSSLEVSALAPYTTGPESGMRAGGWYLYSELQLRFVSRDIFLDGNTFKDSHSVEKETRVGEWQFGLVLPTGRYHWSAYHARRSQEFIDQYADVNFFGIGLSASF